MTRFVYSFRLVVLIALMTVALGAQATVAQTSSTPTSSPVASPEATLAMTKLNLNTATDEQLLTVPGVGDRMLREFKEYRPYTSIVQFRQELGKYVDADQVATWKQYVYVPVDPNAADAETLKQLPGVDDAVAQKLIDGRSYASSDAFLAALAKLVSPADAAAASAYLVTS